MGNQDFNQNVQANYANPNPPLKPKKKKRVGLIILLSLVIIIAIAVGGFFIGNKMLSYLNFGNQKVDYTQLDYTNAMNKAGINFSFEGMTESQIKDFKNSDDYNWTFSDFAKKSFTLMPAELNALVNELLPQNFWLEHIKLNGNKDKKVEMSGEVNTKLLIEELGKNIGGMNPILENAFKLLPKKVNLSVLGDLGINNGKLNMDFDSLKIGPVDLLSLLKTNNLDIFDEDSMLDGINSVLTGLDIETFMLDDHGNFLFDGMLPQTIHVSPKD